MIQSRLLNHSGHRGKGSEVVSVTDKSADDSNLCWPQKKQKNEHDEYLHEFNQNDRVRCGRIFPNNNGATLVITLGLNG